MKNCSRWYLVGFILVGLLLMVMWWLIGFSSRLLILIGVLLLLGLVWCSMVFRWVISLWGENGLVM